MSLIASAKASLQSLVHGHDNQHNPLTMSDDQILQQIFSTHVHSDNFDVKSLFTLTENTLRRSTHIVDNLVQGTHASLEHTDDNIPRFDAPICTLRQISFEMSCKPPSEEVAHKTTMAILNKLKNYEWDAKAVLTLAAFSLDYSEFWLLSQYSPTDPLAKSLAILKHVPVLTRPEALQKYHQAIVEVNNLVKATMQVIELLSKLEKLTTNSIKDVPALGEAIEQIPVDVYWAIITIVAVVTQIDCLTTESERKQELSHYGQKINITLSKLRKQINICKIQIAEVEYHRRLVRAFQTPTEILETLKLLIFSKDAPQSLFDGDTKTTIDISVIKKKDVYLFISPLDVAEEDISVLRPVYDFIKTKDQYKIVWIPIVEEWTEQLKKKFEILKSKMPWYVVQHFGTIPGYKYIKEEWHYKKTSMVVVLNPQSKVLHTNAFYLIRAYGLQAFPFTFSNEEQNNLERNWVPAVLGKIHPSFPSIIKEQKHVFFYGGNDKEWIQQFTKYATALANDATLKEAKISIELFCVEREDKSQVKLFWNGIESLFVTKFHKTVDVVTQEVQKILSFKNEPGWAFLTKGPAVVANGYGTTILKAVAEFEKWRENVIKKGFEISLNEYLRMIVSSTHRCSHLEIQNVAGKLPETIKCPDCPKTMEIFISYKCCHTENTGNATR